MNTPLTYSDCIFVSASPDDVYAVVSDVTRTGEWSPVCQTCWWDEGDGPRVGAFFTGRNVTEDRTWETRCEVIVAEEAREFGWSVTEGNVHWIYSMAPAEDGTELTESWVFTPKGQTFFEQRFGDNAPREVAARVKAAHEGIPLTLAAIKNVIEQQ